MCETGKLFWFPPRNFPTPIQFDDSDDLHTNFICCVVKILFKILNISFAFQSDEDLKLEITKEIKINV